MQSETARIIRIAGEITGTGFFIAAGLAKAQGNVSEAIWIALVAIFAVVVTH